MEEISDELENSGLEAMLQPGETNDDPLLAHHGRLVRTSSLPDLFAFTSQAIHGNEEVFFFFFSHLFSHLFFFLVVEE